MAKSRSNCFYEAFDALLTNGTSRSNDLYEATRRSNCRYEALDAARDVILVRRV